MMSNTTFGEAFYLHYLVVFVCSGSENDSPLWRLFINTGPSHCSNMLLPDPGFGSAEMDLDVISSTSGLNISAAKHKIAIKQKGKRASSHVLARRHRTTSPVCTALVYILT